MKNIYAALLTAQRDMGPVYKDSKGNFGKYANLGTVIEVISETLTKNGLVFVQPLGIQDGMPVLFTRIVHAATGESIESVTPLVCKDPSDPQKLGGAITYFRRYSLLSLLGLAPEDDDGQKASTPAPASQRREQPQNGNGNHTQHDAAESKEMTSWTEFWSWARANNFETKQAIEDKVGGSINDKSPQQVKTALEVAMKAKA